MNKLRSPLPWQGGKHYSAENIVNEFPLPSAYDVYVDLFGGAAHVLIQKPVYKHVEVYNDIHSDLTRFWMFCRDNVEELEGRCRSLPYSREIYYQYHKSLFDGSEIESLERAVRWFYVLRSNFNGYLGASPGGWTSSAKNECHGPAHSYQSAIEMFRPLQQRFQRVMIDNRDFEQVFKHWNKPRTLFYVDPPYVDAERYYEQPFVQQDHRRLARLLNSTSTYIALSYYPHPLLDELYPVDKWRRVTWETPKHSQRTKVTHDMATEMLLCNYPEPVKSLWDLESEAS